jgi:hypothetical protein
MSSVNVADEDAAYHSVYIVVSGAVRSAKLENIHVEMSVVEVAIVDVLLYDAMERIGWKRDSLDAKLRCFEVCSQREIPRS